MFPPAAAAETCCYLTTIGRKTGLAREIEIWFAIEGGVLYLLAGNGETAQWVQNLRAQPPVTVRIADRTLPGTARVVTDPAEDARARRVLLEKYTPGHADDLTGWGRTSLPIAVEFRA